MGLGRGSAGPPLTCCFPTQEWREKALFANLLEPVLQRERWGWDLRHQDFNLYARPPAFLELPPAPKPGAGESRASAQPGPAQDGLTHWRPHCLALGSAQPGSGSGGAGGDGASPPQRAPREGPLS